jgi:GT2 family glycosyltransferase
MANEASPEHRAFETVEDSDPRWSVSDSEHRAPLTDSDSQQNGSEHAGDPVLSVVVPTLNEAENIGDCIESILSACTEVPKFEIILVDSNSDDQTVEIAQKYPVTILQLSPAEHITPGAGRYVGTVAASGDQILFVDGDMRLTQGWLLDAQRFLRDNELVAGVGGHLDTTSTDTTQTVRALHGVVLYDAEVFDMVGGFDPYLQGYEDIELGARIRSAGFELVELPVVVATHSRPQNMSELKRRWQNGYLFGFGQALRKSITSPKMIQDLLSRKRHQVLFLGWFILGAAAVFISTQVLLGWAVVTGGAFGIGMIYQGPRLVVIRTLWQAVSWAGYTYGFFRGSRDPSTFPLETVSLVTTAETSDTTSKEPFLRS